jgi:hypothetical protein
MPQKKNPFEVLGIMLDEARLYQRMDKQDRERAFTHLRRYKSQLYSDVLTGANPDPTELAKINGAFDDLNSNFDAHLGNYISGRSRLAKPDSSNPVILKQAEYFKRQAAQQVDEAKRQVQAANSAIEKQRETIDDLLGEVHDLKLEVWDLQGHVPGQPDYVPGAAMWKTLKREYREMLFSALTNNPQESKPNDAIYLSDLIGHELQVGLTKNGGKLDILKVENGALVRKGILTYATKYEETGPFVGALDNNIIDKYGIGGNNGNRGLVTDRTVKFDHLLLNMKDYIMEGMHPVTLITYRGNDAFFVHGQVMGINNPR